MHLTAITKDMCRRNRLFVWRKQNTLVFASRKDAILGGCVKCHQPLHRTPHKSCDRQRWLKYIYSLLKVIRTTFTSSCQGVVRSLALHYFPLLAKLWCQASAVVMCHLAAGSLRLEFNEEHLAFLKLIQTFRGLFQKKGSESEWQPSIFGWNCERMVGMLEKHTNNDQSSKLVPFFLHFS